MSSKITRPNAPTASEISKHPASIQEGKACILPKLSSAGYKKVGSHYEPRQKLVVQKFSSRSGGAGSAGAKPGEEIEQVITYDVDGEMEEGYSYEEEDKGASLKAHIPHYHLDEYKLKKLDREALFPKVVHQKGPKADIEVLEATDEKPSILVTGFGMRNLKSLQDLLDAEEQKRLLELYKRQMLEKGEEEGESITRTTVSKESTVKSSETSTEKESATMEAQLQYLMGLEKEEIEEFGPMEPLPEEKEDFIYSSSVSMRNAQKYLRVHRIFDFFQFITAHLLSATPTNPIQFILELLNKCLLYRAGAGKPPTLYEPKHFNQLFFLMDRMNTGYIEFQQYQQGMKTFGICEYNQNPAITYEGITKDTFVEEVQEAHLRMFEDLIRRKVIDRIPRPNEFSPPKYEVPKAAERKSAYFMPDDLFKPYKKEKMEQIKEEIEKEEW